jgi:hypothetical protein
MTKIFCETPIQDCYSSYRKILKSEFIIFYLIRLFAYSELQSEEMGIEIYNEENRNSQRA